MVRTHQFLAFWLGNVLRASAQFFDIVISKRGLNPSVFSILTRKCASCHTIFRHRNFKKWSEPVSSLAFWLGNALRATAVCDFPTSEIPKSGPTFSVENVLPATAACKFSCLSETAIPPHPPLYRAYFSTLPTHKPLEKHSRLSKHFATVSSFLWLYCLLTLLLCSAFHLSILSEIRLLNFIRQISNSITCAISVSLKNLLFVLSYVVGV